MWEFAGIRRSKYPVTRACLKIHSRYLHAPLCGIFGSHSVNAAHYVSLIRAKSPADCDVHLTESNFQTYSSKVLGSFLAEIKKWRRWFLNRSFYKKNQKGDSVQSPQKIPATAERRIKVMGERFFFFLCLYAKAIKINPAVISIWVVFNRKEWADCIDMGVL